MWLYFTTAIATITQVLEKYWKDWKRRHTDPPFPFMFSGKKVRGMLSLPCGEGWEASLKGAAMVRGLDWCSRVVMRNVLLCTDTYVYYEICLEAPHFKFHSVQMYDPL